MRSLFDVNRIMSVGVGCCSLVGLGYVNCGSD